MGKNYSNKKSMYRIAKKVYNQQSETKRLKSNSTNTTVGDEIGNANTAGEAQLYSLSTLGAGTSEGQRIGNEVRASSIHLKGVMTANASSTITALRLMVIQSKTGELPLTDCPASLVSQQDTDEYRILHDKIYALSGNTEKIKQFNLRFPIYKMRYVAKKLGYPAGASSAASSNNLYLYAISNEAVSGAQPPRLLWTSMFYYKD